VVDAKFAGNPMEDQAWQPWQDAFKRATDAINAKKAELKPIPVEPCRELPPQQPPPEPPPPAGPGIDLPQPKVRPVAYPTFKLPFCSESDKQTVIQAFRAVAWDYYMNYQDARVYHDAITEALAQGRGNASVLRGLLPGARKSLDVHAKALDDFNKELDRVRAMKVEDCEEKQQPAPDPIPPLVFDPFVFPAVPDEFCTQDAKDETVRQLQAARNTARRNYDKAAARITELGERITRGDNSPATSAAFREANQQASEWLQQSQKLDADMQRAAAMPVVQCATPVQKSVPQHSFGTGIKAGLTFAATNFPKFGEIVGDRPGITEYSANDTPIYYGPFVEFNVAEQVRFGASVLFGTHSFTQGYTGSEITGQVGGIFADTRVSYAYPIGKVNLLGGAGITWAYNNLSDVVQVNGVVTELPGKTLSGFMANLGAAIETALLGRFGGRFSADYITSFKQPNADEHWRASFTLFHAF
jgi:hypothetical protein